ncbi:MAG: hypothetical protein OXU77_21035 [Gammaproteobacteria bacterium]|nr:hypothetical protein [Gammaproteobacteria bacterium]MDE0441986.1 hypothetical protein [Gammaproteobacteria bacterium]
MIEASAPGKLVISGEYAVLAGAPALVAAVDRRVTCTLTPKDSGGWRFVSTGFDDDRTIPKDDVFSAPPTTIPGVVQRSIAAADAPEHIEVRIDSSDCYSDGVKLGVGSSAATVTALATAFGVMAGEAPRLTDLYELHAGFQGGGSGLDVAAAVTGGVIRFEDRVATPVRLPGGIYFAFVFTGSGSRTAALLETFDAWRQRGATAPLERLAAAAREVVDSTMQPDAFVDALGEYTDLLERFDQSTRIGIFGPGHRRARELSSRLGVVYKPCGAGGGDTGVAVSTDIDAIRAFKDGLDAAGLVALDMKISPQGVEFRTG